MRTGLFILTFAGLCCVAIADETATLGPKVFQTLRSADEKVTVELRGSEDELDRPTQAWVVSAAGERRFLTAPATYINGGSISADGRYIVLSYHVSSGGYGAAFERLPKGGYRDFIENGYAMEQIEKGKVPGLRARDIPQLPGRNIYCGLYLAESPDRLMFPIGEEFELTYSLPERRITGWERKFLEYAHSDETGDLSLSLRQRSGERGVAVVFSESQGEDKNLETLAAFPGATVKVEKVKEFTLRRTFSKADFITLAAQQITEASEDEVARWRVEITGNGGQHAALLSKLSAWRDRMAAKTTADAETRWPAPAQFHLTRP